MKKIDLKEFSDIIREEHRQRTGNGIRFRDPIKAYKKYSDAYEQGLIDAEPDYYKWLAEVREESRTQPSILDRIQKNVCEDAHS